MVCVNKEISVDGVEAVDTNYSKFFIRTIFRRAVCEVMTPMLEHDGVRKASESGIT